MKRTGTCPKCGGKDLLRIEGTVGAYGSGNHIPVGITSFSAVKVHRYLCCGCGYSEEWVDQEDLPKLEKAADRFCPCETISRLEKGVICVTRNELKAAAIAMLDRAYIPYSRFPVGAALECEDGTVYTGCNVENAAYPAGICAERNAIFHAVAEGRTAFKRIVVAGNSQDFCVPCGVCRQVMREFAPELEIICLNGAGEEQVFTLEQLLPHSFGPDHLSDPG